MSNAEPAAKSLMPGDPVREGAYTTETRRQEALFRAVALQNAIFNSANFSSIEIDANGIIQIFNVRPERMLGYTASASAAAVMNTIMSADISDPLEKIARAEALSARDGNQGIAMAREARSDAILMDINPPGISGISGITAMQILAADPASAAIPVTALSANARPRDLEKRLEAGFFHDLTKPVKVGAFIETLDVVPKYAAAAENLSESPSC